MIKIFSAVFSQLRRKNFALRFEKILLILLALSVCVSEPFSRNIIRIIFVMVAVTFFIGRDNAMEIIKRYKNFLLPISAFAWWMIISSIYGGDIITDDDSNVYWFFFSHNMILFIPMIIMIRGQKNSEKLLIATAMSLLIEDIFIFYQLGQGVINPIAFLNDSPFQSSILYVILLPTLLILTLSAHELRKQIFYGGTFFISLAAFLFLYTKFAQIVLAIIFLIILFEGLRHYKKSLILAMAAGIFLIMSQGTLNGEDVFTERKIVWSSAIEIISENPIMGVGLGNLHEFLPKNLIITHVYNTYLQFWAETGIFGLLLFCGIFGAILIWSKKRTENLYGKILFFSTLSLMLYAATDFIFESYSAMRLYWFLLGVCVASLDR